MSLHQRWRWPGALVIALCALVVTGGPGCADEPAPPAAPPPAAPSTAPAAPPPATGAPPPGSAEFCAVPDDLVYVDARLPHTATALAAGRPLRVAVVGTASSMGRGVSRPERAYPVRLREELERQLGGKVAVELTNLSRPRWQAEEMLAAFPTVVLPLHPDLVIWQAGTTDAIAGVTPEGFEQTLDSGVELLQQQGSDVILMDMQYNPHTITMISFDSYLDQFAWVSQVKDVLLFHRHDIMKWWIENGVIGLSPETRPEQLRDADIVHGCIGYLLAGMVVRAVRPPPESAPSEVTPGAVEAPSQAPPPLPVPPVPAGSP